MSEKITFVKHSLRKTLPIVITIAITLALVSCKNYVDKEDIDSTTQSDQNNVIFEGNESDGEIIGDYQYPVNPAEELRSALESDAIKRELPIKVGGVEKVVFDDKESEQIKITFNNENMCIITFVNKDNGYEKSLDGSDNPSFTMAFKDSDNSKDMIILLTSVIKYLSPDLSFEEAERLATKQDNTISTDGYSMPQDIGGYQVQSHYSNPHVFVRTPDFESKLGVEVRALKQLWNGTINVQKCKELVSIEDYDLLDISYWEESKYPAVVYADFKVKNMWQKQSYIHGETWVVVDVESMTGEQYSLSLDTWIFPDAYEFGVGQQYTLFIGLNYISGVSGGIIYAIQRSESSEFNSRGKVQPIDYPTDDWQEPLIRIEPEGDGIVYNVSFALQSQMVGGDEFAALEGHGVGQKQWPKDPSWDGYMFDGWYDNLEWNGEPYTYDTQIYKDTTLYAKWKYSDLGGVWPREHRGYIQGIDEKSILAVGQKITFYAKGYNMNLNSPKDQRFRWIPTTWRLSDGIIGKFSVSPPFESILSVNTEGKHQLYITYTEEVFDEISWQKTGQVKEVEEVTFASTGNNN